MITRRGWHKGPPQRMPWMKSLASSSCHRRQNLCAGMPCLNLRSCSHKTLNLSLKPKPVGGANPHARRPRGPQRSSATPTRSGVARPPRSGLAHASERPVELQEHSKSPIPCATLRLKAPSLHFVYPPPPPPQGAVLLGDAAHSTGGASGQGCNSALQDSPLIPSGYEL